jgi:hypothetical protein
MHKSNWLAINIYISNHIKKRRLKGKNPTTPQLDYKKKTRDFKVSLIRNHILTGYPKTHPACEDQKIALVMDIFWIHQDSDQ